MLCRNDVTENSCNQYGNQQENMTSLENKIPLDVLCTLKYSYYSFTILNNVFILPTQMKNVKDILYTSSNYAERSYKSYSRIRFTNPETVMLLLSNNGGGSVEK